MIFGAKWADAIPLLQVLACTAAIGNTAMYATTALVAVNRSHLTIKAEVATTVLALALVYGLGHALWRHGRGPGACWRGC